MDEILISLFLFSAGVFVVMIFAKRSSKDAFSIVHTIQLYAIGFFFLLGSVLVLFRFLYHRFWGG